MVGDPHNDLHIQSVRSQFGVEDGRLRGTFPPSKSSILPNLQYPYPFLLLESDMADVLEDGSMEACPLERHRVIPQP